VTDYNIEVQKLFLNFILSNGVLYVRVQNIFNPENFDKTLRPVAKFIQKHITDYSAVPTYSQVSAITSIIFEPIEDVVTGHIDWFMNEFEQFTKRAELERAILKSADLLEKGDFGPVEKLIKDAVQISLTRNLGIDYFTDPRGRLMRLKNSNGQVSTGWKEVDEKLYGGMNRGELNIFSGLPGAGKSLFLQNISLNWMSQGLNGVYITLELNADLVAMRLDSMLTGISSKNIFKNLDEVELKVGMAGKKSGRLRIKYMPPQSTVNDFRAYIKELKIQDDFDLDFLVTDYLDLIFPSTAKINPSDIFTKDKLVSEELRALHTELNCLGASASQLGRSGFDELEFDMGNIAGGISKANTADNMFGIFTSRSMKERGAIQLQFLKTRNSAGVGSKVDLDFNIDSLRITNQAEGEKVIIENSGSNILSRIKKNSTNQAPVVKDERDLLKGLLSKINK
jgi:archaellum biogenesis ATPase FlaH